MIKKHLITKEAPLPEKGNSESKKNEEDDDEDDNEDQGLMDNDNTKS